ncbi:hypothetical protein BDQ17DRAFT_1333498 [Cyathus striatus]|nr:hypothetical protein BDQ17DRAFT_1333498 [Cyathus striatus]
MATPEDLALPFSTLDASITPPSPIPGEEDELIEETIPPKLDLSTVATGKRKATPKPPTTFAPTSKHCKYFGGVEVVDSPGNITPLSESYRTLSDTWNSMGTTDTADIIPSVATKSRDDVDMLMSKDQSQLQIKQIKLGKVGYHTWLLNLHWSNPFSVSAIARHEERELTFVYLPKGYTCYSAVVAFGMVVPPGGKADKLVEGGLGGVGVAWVRCRGDSQNYTKADMDSLRTVFFVTNYQFSTGSEHIAVLEDLHKSASLVPAERYMSQTIGLLTLSCPKVHCHSKPHFAAPANCPAQPTKYDVHVKKKWSL